MESFQITDLFNGTTRYFIPGYQRGYSWENQQIKDFFRDIELMTDEHYTGMITIKSLRDGKKEVVDGQQRLSTIILTAAALLKVKKGDRIFGIPKDIVKFWFIENQNGPIITYESESDTDFLMKIINGVRINNPNRLSIYKRNLVNAYGLIVKSLDQYNQDELDEFFQKLLHKMKIHRFEINSNKASCQMFESINYRGKDLTSFEVLKNRLMTISYIIQNNDANADAINNKINKSWGYAYQALGDSPQLIDEDSFCRVHSLFYHNIGSKSIKEGIINGVFSIENAQQKKISASDLNDYVTNIKESARIYAWVVSPFSEITELNSFKKQIEKNRRIGLANFEALIVCTLQKFLNNEIKKKNVNDLLKACERYSFIMFALLDKRTDHQKSTHNGLANKFFKNEIDIKEVIEKINSSIDGPNGVYPNIKLESIVQAIKSRFNEGGGYYERWKPELKYLLSEWEEFNGNPIDDLNTVEIEHIFPQDPKGEFLNLYNKWYKKGMEKYFLNDVGNLCLLEKSINLRALNNDFDVKKMIYSESKFAKDIINEEKWTEDEITKRGKRIINFIWDRWNFKLDSDEKYHVEEFLAITMKGVKR